jgi:hypothetical protein
LIVPVVFSVGPNTLADFEPTSRVLPSIRSGFRKELGVFLADDILHGLSVEELCLIDPEGDLHQFWNIFPLSALSSPTVNRVPFIVGLGCFFSSLIG